MPDFWNATALRFLQFRFQKSIKSPLLQLFPFSLTINIIVIITIVFLILVLFIWLHFQFIIYDGLWSIVSLLFLYLFSFLLFVSYSKFIFVPFFFIYFLFCHFPFLLCLKWVHHVLHLLVFIFSDILISLKKKSSEENAKTIWTIGKTQAPIAFAVVLV